MPKRDSPQTEKPAKRCRKSSSKLASLPLTVLPPDSLFIEVGKSTSKPSQDNSPTDAATVMSRIKLGRLHNTPLQIGLNSELFNPDSPELMQDARDVFCSLSEVTGGFAPMLEYIQMNGGHPVVFPSPMHAFVCLMLALDTYTIIAIVDRYASLESVPEELKITPTVKKTMNQRRLVGLALDTLVEGITGYQDPQVRLRRLDSIRETDMLNAMYYCFHEAILFRDPISNVLHTSATQFARALMSTGQSYIIEGSYPLKKGGIYNRWGATATTKGDLIEIRGENIAGKALMMLRNAVGVASEWYRQSLAE